MKMRKALVVGVAAAGLMALSAPMAVAGEITGNGKDTPIRSHTAASICAFSGLNDHTGFFEGRTQNYGQAAKTLSEMTGLSRGDAHSELKADGDHPGAACAPGGGH